MSFAKLLHGVNNRVDVVLHHADKSADIVFFAVPLVHLARLAAGVGK